MNSFSLLHLFFFPIVLTLPWSILTPDPPTHNLIHPQPTTHPNPTNHPTQPNQRPSPPWLALTNPTQPDLHHPDQHEPTLTNSNLNQPTETYPVPWPTHFIYIWNLTVMKLRSSLIHWWRRTNLAPHFSSTKSSWSSPAVVAGGRRRRSSLAVVAGGRCRQLSKWFTQYPNDKYVILLKSAKLLHWGVVVL